MLSMILEQFRQIVDNKGLNDISKIGLLKFSEIRNHTVILSDQTLKNIGRNPIVDCERNGEIEKNRKKQKRNEQKEWKRVEKNRIEKARKEQYRK